MNKARLVPAAMALCLLFAANAPAAGPGEDIYAGLLASAVRGGRVDYRALRDQAPELARYLNAIASVDPETLAPQEQKAYYINAYNAWTLSLVLSRYPIGSIKDLGGLFSSPWKIKFVKLPGHEVSLDFIEHEILRPRFKDPRIHMALNCSAKSCPPLRAEPYRAGTLDAQLDDAARAFVNDPKSNYLEGATLRLSKIFDWFGADFGGEAGVAAFVARYAAPELAAKIKAAGAGLTIAYLDYDWSLNDVDR